MTEIEELRKAYEQMHEQIVRNDEWVKQALKRIDEARRRMRKAAGLPPDEEQPPH